MDPLEFLRQHAPFSELDVAARKLVARDLEVDYVEAGRKLLNTGGDPARVLSMLRRGEVEIRPSQGSVQRLGPGDCFGETAIWHCPEKADTLVTLALYCFLSCAY